MKKKLIITAVALFMLIAPFVFAILFPETARIVVGKSSKHVVSQEVPFKDEYRTKLATHDFDIKSPTALYLYHMQSPFFLSLSPSSLTTYSFNFDEDKMLVEMLNSLGFEYSTTQTFDLQEVDTKIQSMEGHLALFWINSHLVNAPQNLISYVIDSKNSDLTLIFLVKDKNKNTLYEKRITVREELPWFGVTEEEIKASYRRLYVKLFDEMKVILPEAMEKVKEVS